MKAASPIIVFCTKDSEPDVCFYYPEMVSSDSAAKEAAIFWAKASGYCDPFVCFDVSEHSKIANIVGVLEAPIPFNLQCSDVAEFDDSYSKSLKGNLVINKSGIDINLDGHSSRNTLGAGLVALLDYHDACPSMLVYSDINIEEPTANIKLAGARNSCRNDKTAP